jgi:hypothetical protein
MTETDADTSPLRSRAGSFEDYPSAQDAYLLMRMPWSSWGVRRPSAQSPAPVNPALESPPADLAASRLPNSRMEITTVPDPFHESDVVAVEPETEADPTPSLAPAPSQAVAPSAPGVISTEAAPVASGEEGKRSYLLATGAAVGSAVLAGAGYLLFARRERTNTPPPAMVAANPQGGAVGAEAQDEDDSGELLGAVGSD